MKILHLLQSFVSRFRFGPATNSSSMHSVILLAPEAQKEALAEYEDHAGGDFGWDYFKLLTPEQKTAYCAAILQDQVGRLLSRGAIRSHEIFLRDEAVKSALEADREAMIRLKETYVRAYLGPFCPDSLDFDVTVDHQSAFLFPIDPQTRLPHVGFFRWFVEQMRRPEVVILGGNDDQGVESKPEVRGTDAIPLYNPLARLPLEAPLLREEKDHFLLYYPNNSLPEQYVHHYAGLRVRVQKQPMGAIDAPLTASPQPPQHPELIDVKVTDSCGFRCAYCYQGSTPEGKHSQYNGYEAANLIIKLRPLEVAIGGGEPMDWPDLLIFAKRLSSEGIAVAVTTRKVAEIPYTFWRLLAGVGFSVDTAEQLLAGLRSLKLAGISSAYREADAADVDPFYFDRVPRHKLTVQIVSEALGMAQTIAILTICERYHLRVLLLGYKRQERGADYPTAYPPGQFLEDIWQTFSTESRGSRVWVGPAISVDSCLIAQIRANDVAWQTFQRFGVDGKTLAPMEGETSFYVDLVKATFGPSSYSDQRIPFVKDTHRPWQEAEANEARILQHFRKGWK